MSRLRNEDGVTLIELLVVIATLGVVMAGVTNLIVSGSRASTDTAARLDAQAQVRTAFDRLEFEGRCASNAELLSGGAGVHFTLPAQCSHATGNTSWCVSSGTLSRYAASSCTGTAQGFATGVTTAHPFTLLTATGDLPRLQISLTIGGFTQTDAITLRNAGVGT
jgi:prepilin-type N-terminal cleavage/methylation domain-containing protein